MRHFMIFFLCLVPRVYPEQAEVRQWIDKIIEIFKQNENEGAATFFNRPKIIVIITNRQDHIGPRKLNSIRIDKNRERAR